MSSQVIKRIVLSEIQEVAAELTEEQRLILAIDIALALLTQSIKQHS